MWRDRGLRVTSQAAGQEVGLTARRAEEDEKSPGGPTNNDDKRKEADQGHEPIRSKDLSEKEGSKRSSILQPITQQKRQQLTALI